MGRKVIGRFKMRIISMTSTEIKRIKLRRAEVRRIKMRIIRGKEQRWEK